MTTGVGTRLAVQRHHQIHRLRAKGLSLPSIAKKLRLPYSTVHNHIIHRCVCQSWQPIGGRLTITPPQPIKPHDTRRRCLVCHHLFYVDTLTYDGANKAKWPICIPCREQGWLYNATQNLLTRKKALVYPRCDGRTPVKTTREHRLALRRAEYHRRRPSCPPPAS